MRNLLRTIEWDLDMPIWKLQQMVQKTKIFDEKLFPCAVAISLQSALYWRNLSLFLLFSTEFLYNFFLLCSCSVIITMFNSNFTRNVFEDIEINFHKLNIFKEFVFFVTNVDNLWEKLKEDYDRSFCFILYFNLLHPSYDAHLSRKQFYLAYPSHPLLKRYKLIIPLNFQP